MGCDPGMGPCRSAWIERMRRSMPQGGTSPIEPGRPFHGAFFNPPATHTTEQSQYLAVGFPKEDVAIQFKGPLEPNAGSGGRVAALSTRATCIQRRSWRESLNASSETSRSNHAEKSENMARYGPVLRLTDCLSVWKTETLRKRRASGH